MSPCRIGGIDKVPALETTSRGHILRPSRDLLIFPQTSISPLYISFLHPSKTLKTPLKVFLGILDGRR
jgi:hypothetical protein